jgi:acetyl-CoA carboxylase carboxyltransferase component
MEDTAVAPPSSRLSPFQRLSILCDSGTLHPIRSDIRSRTMGDARPGDGVVGAAGMINGRPVFCFAQDATFLGGSLGEAHADTVVRVLELASRAQIPVIGCIESAGARMQEGVGALGGYSRIFFHHVALSGLAPQISIVSGSSAGGGSYAPALTDFTVMVEDACMFLTGPAVVREVTHEDVTAAELGGVRVQERNGVCQFAAPGFAEAVDLARELLQYLPQNSGELPPKFDPEPPEPGDPGDCLPEQARRTYDVRAVIRRLVDGGRSLEFGPKWAPNLVTAFARIDGRSVGIVANQPRHAGGTLDAESSEKGARFVNTCDAFRLPVVVLVDTPGFMPGTKQERQGVIRRGAALVRAFAMATVPRVTVITRRAYGGAYITMNSKDLGAHFAFAWTGAEIGVMGAAQAINFIHRREIAAAEDETATRAALADAYAHDHISAAAAARAGFIDEVIRPCDTRSRLAWSLQMLSSRRRRSSDPPASERGAVGRNHEFANLWRV